MYKMFENMFNNFAFNEMKIISYTDKYYSACTSIANFDWHDKRKLIILQIFALTQLPYVQKHKPLDEMNTKLPLGCAQNDYMLWWLH